MYDHNMNICDVDFKAISRELFNRHCKPNEIAEAIFKFDICACIVDVLKLPIGNEELLIVATVNNPTTNTVIHSWSKPKNSTSSIDFSREDIQFLLKVYDAVIESGILVGNKIDGWLVNHRC